ncbi:MAG: leucyl/phenylalanyl-tRNA--protein transferase [Planctomycetaceae bacterium]|nr:leucyl/phenylalanyl-tRNA--protein transferase [Planctomycetaceae bacterium]
MATPSRFFPPASHATPIGLVAVGGSLSVDRLLDAYRHGIFPWPTFADEPMLWWSPDPRAIMPLDGFHVSRRLARRLRSGQFVATCDTAFEQVIRACSRGPGREGGTWLTPEMIAAYTRLHQRGHAHSVEIWSDERLVGGVYGVGVGGAFAAESMFYRATDGSKAALAHLVTHLTARGYRLLDIQQWTRHTGSLGAMEVRRRDYLQLLSGAVALPVTFGVQLQSPAEWHNGAAASK